MARLLRTFGLLAMWTALVAPALAQTCTGLYSLARTAVPTLAKTGDLAFVPYQQDAPSHSGTLKAFALKSNGSTEETPTWDANNQASQTHRQARLYTNSSSAGGALQTLDSALTIGAEAKVRIYGGAKNLVEGSWDSWYGKPGATAPVIHKDLVLFATNDGFLYGLDKATGEMKWGWIPQVFVADLQTLATSGSSTVLLNHNQTVHDQFQVVTVNGADYVLGTAKGGSLHYALALSSTGQLSSMVWMDDRPGSVLAAPTVLDNQAYYAISGKLVQRSIAVNDKPVETDETLSAAPVVVKDATGETVVYIGNSLGNVQKGTYGSNGKISWSTLTTTTSSIPATAPIQHLIYTQTLQAEYLTVQSGSRITTLKQSLPENNRNPWRPIWSSAPGSSQQLNYADGRAASTNTVPALPSGAVITDRATSVGGFVLTPVTLGTGCSAEARLYRFALDPEVTYYQAFINGSLWNTTFMALGSGKALSASPMYLDGKLSAQGHSQQNSVATKLGLDNPIEFRPVTTNSGSDLRRRSWREIIR